LKPPWLVVIQQLGETVYIKQSMFAAALLAAIVVLPINAADNSSFSGKWAVDKNARVSGAPEGLTEVIRQSGNQVTIEARFKEPANGIAPLLYLGVMATKVTLSTDGSEVTNQIGPFTQLSKTTLNGNKMETDWTATVNGDQVKGHWVRTLSDDGKSMTLDIHESSTQGQSGVALLRFARK
jgi:hypothetical protein